MLGLTRYQWLVLTAAWLGWGFDVFDALLFNYVAPNAVPTLLGLTIGSPEAQRATLYWTGLLTSILLVGWAIGGVLFGVVCDRIGRTRTLVITMLMYAFGTAACAFAPSMGWLIACRAIASLGIGGEWAAGATMVAETVPEHRRVEAGVILQSASPVGLFLATGVNWLVAGHLLPNDPQLSWRVVLLFGLLPALVAIGIRAYVAEPERWQRVADKSRVSLLELFTPERRAVTLAAFLMSLVVLLTWWSCNAFIPVVASGLAQARALELGLERSATLALVESWKLQATAWFNLGGLVGGLLLIPFAKGWGRRPMFAVYLAACALAIWFAFGAAAIPEARLVRYFLVGVTVYGLACAFPFYLPELFPTRLRATGAGFCYNVGRLFAAGGPFLVGAIAVQGSAGVDSALVVLSAVAIVPVVGLLFLPWVVETRGRMLED